MNAPLCEKCLYFIKGPYVNTGRCTRYSVYRGRGKLVYDFAANVRLDSSKCGPEGRLFEPREKNTSRESQEIWRILLEKDE